MGLKIQQLSQSHTFNTDNQNYRKSNNRELIEEAVLHAFPHLQHLKFHKEVSILGNQV